MDTAPIWVQTENGFVMGTLDLSTEWEAKPSVKLPGQDSFQRVSRDRVQTATATEELHVTQLPHQTTGGLQATELQVKLRNSLREVCADYKSDTPEYILADFLIECLNAFDKATRRRDKVMD